jgi:hypothetical protein
MLRYRALLIGGVALFGFPILTSSMSAAVASTPGCSSGQLMVLASGWYGAAGNGSMAFDIVNRGGRCQVGGYPNVTFVDASDFGVDIHDIHRSSMTFAEPKAVTVTLLRGGVATFGVSWADNPIGNQACPETARAQVELRQGVGNLWGLVPINPSPCGGQLFVTPIESGAWPRPNG